MLGNVVFALQIAAAVVFVILMAIQTDKAEQSGVMGLGAQGGRMSGSIDMPVGAERILKPLTKWVAVGFLFLSGLSAMAGEIGQTSPGRDVSIVQVLVVLAVYVVVMIFGTRVWNAATGVNK